MPFSAATRPEVRAGARASASSSAARGFYSQRQAATYTTAANAAIQRDLTFHALELLWLQRQRRCANNDTPPSTNDEPLFLLDLGAGSGLSTQAAGEWLRQHGVDAFTVAFDISPAMIALTQESSSPSPSPSAPTGEDHVPAHHLSGTYAGNAAQRFPLRPNLCDAAIGVSMLQWLNDDGLRVCYESLREVLKPGGVAVFQVYPTSTEQAAAMEAVALTVGFTGAELVVGFPHSTPSKKWFLILTKGNERHDGLAQSPDPRLRADIELPHRQCPFGARYQRPCVWHIYAAASVADDHVLESRRRLGREHVKEAWHIWRKHRRAVQMGLSDSGSHAPPLTEKESAIVNALGGLFADNTEAITYEVMLNATCRIVEVFHTK